VAQTQQAAADQQDMLELAQTRALAKLQPHGVAAALDAETWMKIGMAILELFLECRKQRSAEDLSRIVKRPQLIQKLRLRRSLVKHVGRAQLKQLKGEHTLVEALTEVGADATDSEVKAFVAQILQG
jgi:hypothetical protein